MRWFLQLLVLALLLALVVALLIAIMAMSGEGSWRVEHEG
jgi:ABC-type arginine/histidine transport system permease subunit